MAAESMAPPSLRPAGAPPAFHLLAKPSGSTCNIDCAYCFFLSKEALYPDDKHRMSEATLESYIRQLIEAHRTPEVTVAWQGGEPTLMKLEFFEQAVELVEKYKRPGQTVQQTFQTNGLLLDDAWCAFFKKHNFLVGLSVDGPRDVARRLSARPAGQGTFDLVMRGWRFLRSHGVEFNILCTVNAANQTHGREGLSLLPRRTRREMDAVHPDRRAGDGGHARHRQPGLERSRERGAQAPSVHADRRPRHRAVGGRRAIRPLSDRHLRGVGAARRRQGVRAALRRDSRGLFRPSSPVHPRADLRLRSGARAQRRPLHLRSFRRAGSEARQHRRRRRWSSSSPRRRCASSATTSATR